MLAQLAHKYAESTGCDTATAEQVALVMACLFADMVGRRDIGDYFSARAEQVETKKDGITAVPFTPEPETAGEVYRKVTGNEQTFEIFAKLREFQK